MLPPPEVIYGVGDRPVMATHYGDTVRMHRPLRFTQARGKAAMGGCSHAGCDQPSLIERSVITTRGMPSWRGLCRQHALVFADKLGETLAGIVRAMVAE